MILFSYSNLGNVRVNDGLLVTFEGNTESEEFNLAFYAPSTDTHFQIGMKANKVVELRHYSSETNWKTIAIGQFS